ncbi:hypothetical protein NLX83_10905 [Allokutzneria sp. A3M-2-11 16]|uniref:hypothetical protein n=1 Tax=Allokutzneria sp. A3M-2-11 16 TaxID=2962043 RepID=UPI0020B70576|nr:hypothetical protein [Allokutzneria sp. A3M-2-11 16]MCP3799767.1 hypothetical protein [Allokutzneria sp. A3M-2-11 16]
MTATVVNGLEVIADEPTEAPMRSRAGTPVLWQQTRTLLLEDGSTTYGCVHCDYTSANVRSIRPHLNKHRTDNVPARTSVLAPFGELSLAEVFRRLVDFDDITSELDEMTSERDEWKQRAQRAERSLSTLRNALRGVAS